MKTGVINKINKIRSRRPQKDVYERPAMQIQLPPPKPVKKETDREYPASRVIVIDLM